MSFSPSPPQSRATIEALSVFQRHYPHIFKLDQMPPEVHCELIREWAQALNGVTLAAVGDAAREWIGFEDAIPKASTFGAYARRYDATHFRRPSAAVQVCTPQEQYEDNRRHLTKRAHEKLGSWRLVSEVFERLMSAASDNPAQLSRVRDGRILLTDFDAMVSTVYRETRKAVA